jgi:hypothetical protein
MWTAEQRRIYRRGAMNAILFAAHRLPPALAAARQLSATLDGLQHLRKFQRDGVRETVWAEPHMALREPMGREASPSAAVLDSQVIESAEKGR